MLQVRRGPQWVYMTNKSECIQRFGSGHNAHLHQNGSAICSNLVDWYDQVNYMKTRQGYTKIDGILILILCSYFVISV